MSGPVTQILPPVRTLFAARAAGITGSVIDDSTSLLQRQSHDVVRLGMGSPAPDSVPSEIFAELLAAEARVPSAYDYAATEGEIGLRSGLLELLAANGVPQSDERVLITAGGMQGLDLTCKLFVGAGDLVAVESPTYTNGTATIASYRGTMIEVPVDDDGMDVDALEELVAAEGRTPKLIYTVSTFQNPSGTTLSLSRRRRLLELAERWQAMILEDDPYSMLAFSGPPPPSLAQLSAGRVRVIGVHTFSKILAPGLRIGWVVAEPQVIEMMVRARQGMDTCANTLQQRLVARFIAGGHMDDHLARLRREYALRKRAMGEALAGELEGIGARWSDPDGGFFLWLTLPDEIDAQALFPVALEEGVAYIPGAAFSLSGRFANALRLAFSVESPDRARLGIQRLRRAIDRQLAGSS